MSFISTLTFIDVEIAEHFKSVVTVAHIYISVASSICPKAQSISYIYSKTISFRWDSFRGCLKTIVNGSEFAKGNNYRRHHEHFVGRFSRLFIVSAQPSEVFKPCKGSLHDPSFLGRDKLS